MVSWSKLDVFFDVVLAELILIEVINLIRAFIFEFLYEFLSCSFLIDLIKLLIFLYFLVVYLCLFITDIFLLGIFLCLHVQHGPNVLLI